MFAVNGILFNHTSPRRGETFVEQKIVKGVISILNRKQDCLYLGNLYSYRDYGHAKDYIEAMWLMLQQKNPEDFVIASGKKYMIKDIINLVFTRLELNIDWVGEGLEEHAIVNSKTKYKNMEGKIVVKINKKYFRPSEVDCLIGDATKAINKLGWKPKYNFEDIINEMIEEELKKYL
jgi:GDPmannose 4,6-dehydratase